MDELHLIAIPLSVFGFGMYYFLWHVPRKKRRLENLTQHAMRHGFTVAAETDIAPKEKFAPLRLFCLKSPDQMENVFTGTCPSMWIFDYEYTNTYDHNLIRVYLFLTFPGYQLMCSTSLLKISVLLRIPTNAVPSTTGNLLTPTIRIN